MHLGGKGQALEWEREGADPLLRLAGRTHTRLLSIELARSTLEDAFLGAVANDTRVSDQKQEAGLG